MVFCGCKEARDWTLVSLVRNIREKRILDVGCGKGKRTKLLCINSNHVVGVDISRTVDKSEEFEFLLGDGTRLPIKDCSFDVICAVDTIEHVNKNKDFMSELFRVCRTKGYAIILTPNRTRLSNVLMNALGRKITYPYSLGRNIVHVKEYTMEELVNLIERCGFDILSFMPIWLGLVGRINKDLRFFPKSLGRYAQYLLVLSRKSSCERSHE